MYIAAHIYRCTRTTIYVYAYIVVCIYTYIGVHMYSSMYIYMLYYCITVLLYYCTTVCVYYYTVTRGWTHRCKSNTHRAHSFRYLIRIRIRYTYNALL